MTNPIANADQFAAELDAIAVRNDPRMANAKIAIEQNFARGFRDRMPAEVAPYLGDFCEEYLTNWIFKATASDAQYPRFVRDFMPAYHWHGHDVAGARTGGDNPDNCYRIAGIEHGTAYEVRGKILDSKPANISFTLVANYGTSMTVQTIEDHQLEVDSDGSFIITIDDQPANGRPNHLTTRSDVKLLFVRDSMMNWATETPLELTINRIGDPKADPITREDMAGRAIEHALGDLFLYFWFQATFSNIKANRMTAPATFGGANGGLVTQGSCNGHLLLGADDAVIVDYDPAGAGYSAIQLTEWLFRSIDYDRVQSCLTAAHSQVDKDGRIRAVVARRDPGVANWLDTGGYAHAFIMIRWQAMKSGASDLSATIRTTTIDRLKSELPRETLWFSPEERAAQLKARHDAFLRRVTE